MDPIHFLDLLPKKKKKSVLKLLTSYFSPINPAPRASLGVLWLRLHLLTQETQVRSLVREEYTCSSASKLVQDNHWAWAPKSEVGGGVGATTEPTCHKRWNPCALEPMLCTKRSHHNENPTHCKWTGTLACHNWRKPACTNTVQAGPPKLFSAAPKTFSVTVFLLMFFFIFLNFYISFI